jgi:hypothetical protein
MSDEKNFFARWSRRKYDADAKAIAQSTPRKRDDVLVSELPTAPLAKTSPFDVASLPAVDSIGAESDIRAFLEVGVPADLTRAALRRVWLTDPAIRSFVGLSENSWDFNAPGAIPGFGSINIESVASMVARVLGGPNASATGKESLLKLPDANEDPLLAGAPIEDLPTCLPPGMQNPSEVRLEEQSVVAAKKMIPDDKHTTVENYVSSERTVSKGRRKHGGALPQLP